MQIRLDLTAFVITGPSSDTSARIRRKFGHPFQDLGDTDYGETGSALTGSCLTDTFSATSASISSSPPTICGSAKGEHSKWDVELLIKILLGTKILAIRKLNSENDLLSFFSVFGS